MIGAPSRLHLPLMDADLVIALEPERLLVGTDYRLEEAWNRLICDLRNRARRQLILETSQPDLPFFAELGAVLPRRTIRLGLLERKKGGYPPYGNLLEIVVTGPAARGSERADRVKKLISQVLPMSTILGPSLSISHWSATKTVYRILAKIPGKLPLDRLRLLRARLPRTTQVRVFPGA